MKMNGSTIASVALVMTAFALSALLYDRLPQRMPTHWNAEGQVNGMMDKPLGAFLPPLLMAVVLLLNRLLPGISPEGYKMEPFARSYEWLQLGLLAFLLLVHTCVLLAGLGFIFPMMQTMAVATGGLFVLIGNFMGKLTPNFFMGIRTPWTLSDPEVWLRTHRFAGKVFVALGLVIAALGLLDVRPTSLLAPILLAVLAPVIYSYVAYVRRRPKEPRA